LAKSVLIRHLSDEDAAWLAQSAPPGVTQEAYLRSIVADARRVSASAPTPVRPARKGKDHFRFIDLFAGIGGFYNGMTANGGTCVFTNEWDKWAAQTYRAWTGSDHVHAADIRTLDYAADIPDHDVLCAGFPCQPFSIAGVSKKNSLGRAHGFDDEKQGNLFFAICGIVEAKRPPVLVLENVRNLVSHDKKNTFRVIKECIDDLGYELHAQIIDAQGWVPQHRERIFLVCFDRDAFTEAETDSFRFPKPPIDGPRLGSILEDEPDSKYMLTDGLWAYLQGYAAKHKAAGNGFGFGLVGPGDVTRTMSARYYKDGSEILIRQPGWRNPRRLTPAEAARLMGFNERFSRRLGHGDAFPQVVSDTQAYKQFGNSVSPMVVEAIGKEVVKVLRRRRLRSS
jgi:DNA (cytosine-5)-methyltransferase 1